MPPKIPALDPLHGIPHSTEFPGGLVFLGVAWAAGVIGNSGRLGYDRVRTFLVRCVLGGPFWCGVIWAAFADRRGSAAFLDQRCSSAGGCSRGRRV